MLCKCALGNLQSNTANARIFGLNPESEVILDSIESFLDYYQQSLHAKPS